MSDAPALETMIFKPLYYADRLRIVNPAGDVGLATLWTPLQTAERLLRQVSPKIFDPAMSRIAVLSNLYGDGIHQMLCNLLYNPQIRYLIAIGQDMGLSTTAELEAFFRNGIEETMMLGTTVLRISGTSRIFPKIDGFDVNRLQRQVSFLHLGQLTNEGGAAAKLAGFLDSSLIYRAPNAADRIHVVIPQELPDGYTYRPSSVTNHQVERPRPLDCWVELVTRTIRFGHPVVLASGPRLELLNARAVITDPTEEPASTLDEYGFSLSAFHDYQQKLLDPALPSGITYTYGNRLRSYFLVDAIENVIQELRRNPESRHAYVSLWDTAADLPAPGKSAESAVPCLVTIFFRRSMGQLTLTATYRSHNMLTAWLQNVYGLMAIQREVCEAAGLLPGPLTVISHSLGIDPRSPRYEFSRDIARTWTSDEQVDRVTRKRSLREDPNGYFVVEVDSKAGEIVAEHRYGGLLVKQYRAKRATRIAREVDGDMAVSLPSHALWLGRELALQEMKLREIGQRRMSSSSESDLDDLDTEEDL